MESCSWQNIQLWNNPWFLDDTRFYVETEMNAKLSDVVISDLIIPNRKDCDVELLQELFLHHDMDYISRINFTNVE